MPGNLENASITRKRRISIPINTLHEFGGGNLARGRVVDHQSARALSLDLVDRVPGFFARSGGEGGAVPTGADAHEPGIAALAQPGREALLAEHRAVVSDN